MVTLTVVKSGYISSDTELAFTLISILALLLMLNEAYLKTKYT